jgi:uncharacterized protein (TIGR02246 family)
MRRRTFVGLLSCILFVLSLNFTPSANATSQEEEVLQVMTNWFKAFNTNNADLMTSLYWNSSKTTAFGPGVDSALLSQGWELNAEGWKSITKDPIGTYVNSPSHIQATMLSDNVAIITGYNTQTYTDPATKTQTVSQVRGTFVVQKIGGKWVIVHEHSSMLPVK